MDHGHHESGGDHNGMDHGGDHTMDHGGDHNMDHGGGEMGMDHMMSMTFHFGVKETILFDWWTTTTTNELVVAIFIVGVVAALYEGLKHSRYALLRSSIANRSTLTLPDSTTALHSPKIEPGCAETMFSCTHIVQTLLHAIQFTMAYILMLVFMTYNVWLCIGVVTGATIGFYLFGWRSSSILAVIEHCH